MGVPWGARCVHAPIVGARCWTDVVDVDVDVDVDVR